MKSKPVFRHRHFSLVKLLGLSFGLAAVSLSAPSAYAVSGTFTGTNGNLWADAGNWDSGGIPGAGDTAGFTTSAALVNSNTTIDLGTGQAAGTVLFDTANAAAYTIGAGAVGSQTLTLSDTGAVNMTSAVSNNQLFNANITLGTAAVGTTTITNGTTAASGLSLTFAGTVTGGTGGTAGIKTVNVAGTGAVNFTNALGAGGSTQLNLVETAAGTTTLSGNVTSNLNTLRVATGGGTIAVNGQTVIVAAGSNYGASGTGQFGRFILNSGSVAYNGGIFSNANSSTGTLFQVNGGTFSASTLLMQTTGGTGTDTINTAAPNNTGFVVTGGIATINGVLGINGNTNIATALVSGGTLNVTGDTNVSNGASGRVSRLQVSGGTFNAAGVFLSNSATAVNNSSLLLTGGTTTADSINFGRATSTATSTGAVVLNGAGASLYVGAGGMVLGSANTYTATINLTAGTLGAKADWASTLPMTLNGTATGVTFLAADAGGVAHNISLSGVLSGAGGITKTGGGILTLTGANTYAGGTIANTGTLAVGATGTFGSGNITLAGGVTLTLGNTTAIADLSSLIFANTSIIQMNGTGSETLKSITDSTTGVTLSAPNTYTAANLNSFFGVTSFSGAETFTVIPEPGTYAAVLFFLGLGGVVLHRRRTALGARA